MLFLFFKSFWNQPQMSLRLLLIGFFDINTQMKLVRHNNQITLIKF